MEIKILVYAITRVMVLNLLDFNLNINGFNRIHLFTLPIQFVVSILSVICISIVILNKFNIELFVRDLPRAHIPQIPTRQKPMSNFLHSFALYKLVELY